MIDDKFAIQYRTDLLFHLIRGDIGEKSQTAAVDPDDRNLRCGEIPSNAEQTAVAANDDQQITESAERLTVRYLVCTAGQHDRCCRFDDDCDAARAQELLDTRHRFYNAAVTAPSEQPDAFEGSHEHSAMREEAEVYTSYPCGNDDVPALDPRLELSRAYVHACPQYELESPMASALEVRHHEVLSTANSRLQRAPDTSLWDAMRYEAQLKAQHEPILGSYFHATILNHRSFRSALSFRIASRLDTPMLPTMMIRDVIEEALDDAPSILTSAEIDILAT